MPEAPAVTLVVPVHDSAATLVELTTRARAALEAAGHAPVEVILVDDASTDATWATIATLAARGEARGLRLAPNGGQVAALQHGFAAARAPWILTLDADLDSSPEDLPALLVPVLAGAPAAVGVRIGSRPPIRRIGSAAFNARARRLGYRYRDIGCGSVALPAAAARRLVEAGARAHGFRFKVVLWDDAPELVEVPMRSVRRDDSNYTLSDLALGWLAFEDQVGSRRVPEGLGALVAVASLGLGRRAGAPPLVASAASLAVGTLVTRSLRQRLVRARRPDAPRVVADTAVP